MKQYTTLLLLFVTLLVSCGKSYQEKQKMTKAAQAKLMQEDSLALKLAVVSTLDCLPIYLAADHKMFERQGVDLRLRTYPSQIDCDDDLRKGKVEGMVSDLIRTEKIQKDGIKLNYLSSTNVYWKLITNRKARLTKLEQMGDKTIAMTRFSATDFLTDKALEGVKTKAQVFKIQINSVNIRLSMLLNNSMDAMWLTEPQAAMAINNGNKAIADSRKMGYSLGVIAFRHDKTMDKRRQDQIAAFVKAYNMACDSINKNGISYYSDIATKHCATNEEALATLKDLKFTHISAPSKEQIEVAQKYVKQL